MGRNLSERDEGGRPIVRGIASFRAAPDGSVLDADDELCRWYDVDRAALVGRSVAVLSHAGENEEFLAAIECFHSDPTAQIAHGEHVRQLPEGERERVRFVAIARRTPTGSLDHVEVLALDVDAHGVVEIAPPMSAEHAAALRIVERYGLGPRHAEILILLAAGYRVAMIASTVHLAAGTVRNRISELGDALDVHGQTEILRLVHAEVRAAASADADQS